METPENVTLFNFGGGVLAEKFESALGNVLENIYDPNMKDNIIREINIKIKIKPVPERNKGNVEIEVTEKLAPPYSYSTQIYIGKSADNQLIALENNPKQLQLGLQKDDSLPETNNRVITIGGQRRQA